MKKILSILLAAAMLISMVACTTGGTGDATTTDPAELTPPVETLSLIVAGQSGYSLCRSDKLSADSPLKEAFTRLYTAIREKTGVTLGVSTDWLRPDEAVPELEILVGSTEREESKTVLSELKAANFAIRIVGKKLVIAGGTDDASCDAVNYFIDNVVNKLPDGTKDFSVTSEQNYLYSGEYRINSLTILGKPIAEYSIVIPKVYNASEYRTAQFLQRHLELNAGAALPIIRDNESAACEIRIGKTARSQPLPTGHTYRVDALNGALEISAASMFAYIEMQTYLLDTLFDPTVKEIAIDDGFSFSKDVTDTLSNGAENVLKKSGEIRVMFNNMYGNCQDIHPRPQRQLQLAELYEVYAPDVIGLQECNPQSRGGDRGIDTRLKALGYVEVEASGTNYTPLFYRADTLTLIEGGYARFNDGKGDKSKSYTWGVFEVKATGERFAALSTHFWWKNIDETDNAARITDAEQMMGVVKTIEEKYGCAVITGGDFNCNKSSAPYSKIVTGGFKDGALIAEKKEQCKSHHSYPTYDEDLKVYKNPVMPDSNLDKSIDHILIKNSDKLEVKLYDVVTDLYSLLSTDHCPIYIDVNIK